MLIPPPPRQDNDFSGHVWQDWMFKLWKGYDEMARNSSVTIADSANLDSFSRLRVSTPSYVFDGQLTYNLQPLLFEQITNGTGATIAHDSTNRMAGFTFSSTPTGGKAYMQSYDYFRYQPGRSQLVFVTFNMIEHKADTLKFAGYSDGSNGVEFQSNGTGFQVTLYSDTTNGDQTVLQADWNLDKLNGNGASGITLDVSKTQILVIDMQALYVGRVRVGFDVDGTIVYFHEFLHANEAANPYIQSANLPLRCGMTCTGTVSTTMKLVCASVVSEGGQEDIGGFHFAQEGTVTASSGARTHILSIRPKTMFNSIANREKFILQDISFIVTGTNPVYWELVLGQAISGTTTFNDVNTTYSGFEYNTAGTISGSPSLVIDSGYISASATQKQAVNTTIPMKYPITLDAAGAVRSMGTLSIIVTGIGGTSATRASFGWKEIR